MPCGASKSVSVRWQGAADDADNCRLCGVASAVSADVSSSSILRMLSAVKEYAAVLYVYDAANLSHALHGSDQNETRAARPSFV